MSDEQKSEFIISRACPEIIDWYCNHKQRKAAFNWSRWKEELEEFCSPNKLDIGYVFRLKQKPAETICEYIKLVDEAARVHKLNNEDIIKIILAGMKDEIPDVKRIIIRSKVVDEVLFSDIRLLEGTYQAEKLKKEERRKIKKEKKELEKKELELKKEEIRELRSILTQLKILKLQEPKQITCYNCGKSGHISRYCRAPRDSKNKSFKRIYKVLEDAEKKVQDYINKNNSVYINGLYSRPL